MTMMWRKWNAHILPGDCKMVTSALNSSSHYLAISLLSIYPREMKTFPHKNIYTNAYGIIIHNSEKVETIQKNMYLFSEKGMKY